MFDQDAEKTDTLTNSTDTPNLSTKKPIFKKKPVNKLNEQIDVVVDKDEDIEETRKVIRDDTKAGSKDIEKINGAEADDGQKEPDSCKKKFVLRDIKGTKAKEPDEVDDEGYEFKPEPKSAGKRNVRKSLHLKRRSEETAEIKTKGKDIGPERPNELIELEAKLEESGDDKGAISKNKFERDEGAKAKGSGIGNHETKAVLGDIKGALNEDNIDSTIDNDYDVEVETDDRHVRGGEMEAGSEEEFLNTRRRGGRKRKSTSKYLDYTKRAKKGVEYDDDVSDEKNAEKENVRIVYFIMMT